MQPAVEMQHPVDGEVGHVDAEQRVDHAGQRNVAGKGGIAEQRIDPGPQGQHGLEVGQPGQHAGLRHRDDGNLDIGRIADGRPHADVLLGQVALQQRQIILGVAGGGAHEQDGHAAFSPSCGYGRGRL